MKHLSYKIFILYFAILAALTSLFFIWQIQPTSEEVVIDEKLLKYLDGVLPRELILSRLSGPHHLDLSIYIPDSKYDPNVIEKTIINELEEYNIKRDIRVSVYIYNASKNKRHLIKNFTLRELNSGKEN